MGGFNSFKKERIWISIIGFCSIFLFVGITIFSLNAQVIMGDFWGKAQIPAKGLSLKQIWNAPGGRAGIILSGHSENFEPLAVQMVLPGLPTVNYGTLAVKKDPTLNLKTLLLDVARKVKDGYLLGYDEENFKPVLFSYDGVQVRKLHIQWDRASFLFLKKLMVETPDTLIAVGYMEGEDGRLESRSSVIAQILPLDGRSQVFTRDVPGKEDGFIGVVSHSNLYIALGTIGKRQDSGSRVVAFTRKEFNIQWEKQYPHFRLHKIVSLPDGRIALIGEKNHSSKRENRGVILFLSREGQELGEWVSSYASGDAFLDATLTIDGYLGLCGYQQVDGKQIPVLWKFDPQKRQILYSRQWMGIHGQFTHIADMANGFLITGGETKHKAGKSVIVAVDREVNPVTFPPEINLQTHFEDASGDGRIDHGEKFSIDIVIKNTGKTAAFYPQMGISGALSDIRFFTPMTQILPVLYPGQELHKRIVGIGKASIKPQRFPVKIRITGNPYFTTIKTSRSGALLASTQIMLQGALGKNRQWVSIKTIPSFIVVNDTSIVRVILQNVSTIAIPPGIITFLSSEKSVKILNPRQTIARPVPVGESVQYDISIIARQLPGTISKVPLIIGVSAADGSVEFEATTELICKGSAVFSDKEEALTHQETDVAMLKLNSEVDIEAHIPEINTVQPNRFAVVIGISDYRPPVPRVPYAVKDAFVFKEYLKKMWGVPEGNIFFIPNATKSDMERFFGDEHDYRGKLFNMLTPGQSEVVVFYSGHGAPGREKGEGNYLVPVDADPAYLKLNGYPLNTFLRNLSQLPAKSIFVVMDACFSGQIYTGISPVYVYVPPERRFPPNFAVLSSTTATQPSCWLPEKGHSLFTYMFLKGLQTFKADLNGDGKITVKEMEQYLTDDRDLSHSVPYQARKLQNVEQRPHLMTTNPNLVILRK